MYKPEVGDEVFFTASANRRLKYSVDSVGEHGLSVSTVSEAGKRYRHGLDWLTFHALLPEKADDNG